MNQLDQQATEVPVDATSLDGAASDDTSPEKLPVSAWVSLIAFGAFVVLFGTCAATYMFN